MKKTLLGLFALFLFVFVLSQVVRADVYTSYVRVTQEGTTEPFDGSFTDGTGAAIRFILNDAADVVTVRIIDAGTGSAVKTISATNLSRGENAVIWDGSSDAGATVPTPAGDYRIEITASSGGYSTWTQYFNSGDIDIFTRGADVNQDPTHRLFGYSFAGNNGGPLAFGIIQLTADGSPAGDTLNYSIKETVKFGFPTQHTWSATLDKFGWVYLAGHGTSGGGVGIYQTKIQYDPLTRTHVYTTSKFNDSIPNPIGLFLREDTLYYTSDGYVGRAYFDAAHSAVTAADTVVRLDSANFVRDVLVDDDGYLYVSVQKTGAKTTFGGADADGGWLEKYPLSGTFPKTRQDTVWRYALTDKPLELDINYGTASEASDDKIYMNYRRGTAATHGVYEFTGVASGSVSGVTRTLIASTTGMSSAAGLAVDVVGNVVLFENSDEHIYMSSPPTGPNSYTYTSVDLATVTSAGVTAPLVDISLAREDLNFDYQPDRLGDTLKVIGVVNSVNIQSTNTQYFLQDETGGISLFHTGTGSPPLKFGDKVQVKGAIAYFRGTTEITPGNPATDVIVLDSNQTVTATALTISQYLADPEKYESQRIKLSVVDPLFDPSAWPAQGSDANLNVWDGILGLVLRIDKETEVDGSAMPAFPVELTGTATQFTSSASVHDDGYQITPMYTTDFVPINAPPVALFELLTPADGSTVTLDDSAQIVTFSWRESVDFNEDAVIYQWVPIGFNAKLSNNNGADTVLTQTGVQLLAYLGAGDSVTLRWTVKSKDPTHSPVSNLDTSTVKIKRGTITGIAEDASIPREFYLRQNYPNPFNPSTTISYGLPQAVRVRLEVFNILGQKVTTLVNEEQQPGRYRVTFAASRYSSGTYFYILNAGDRIFKKKMLLVK